MVEEKKEELNLKFVTIVTSVSVIIFLIVTFTLGRFLWNDLTKTSAELKARREILKADQNRLANLKKLKAKEEELKEKNKVVLAALPTDSDVAGLFVQYERIASESGASLKSSTESKTTTGSTTSSAIITTADYALDGQATGYGALKVMLDKTEKALRIISVESLDLSSDSSTVGVKMTTKTFLRK